MATRKYSGVLLLAGRSVVIIVIFWPSNITFLMVMASFPDFYHTLCISVDQNLNVQVKKSHVYAVYKDNKQYK